MSDYNFAYLDEQTKRMIRRAILKGVAIPGYQVPFASREMPMPYGWGTGGVQVTAACLERRFLDSALELDTGQRAGEAGPDGVLGLDAHHQPRVGIR